jgi:hypothetical protein
MFWWACRFWGKCSWWWGFYNDPTYSIPILVHWFVFCRRFYYLRGTNMRARVCVCVCVCVCMCVCVCVIRTFLAFLPILASVTVCIPLSWYLCLFSLCLILFFLLLYSSRYPHFLVFVALSSYIYFLLSRFYFYPCAFIFLYVPFFLSLFLYLSLFLLFSPCFVFLLFSLHVFCVCISVFCYLFLSLSLVYFSFFPSKRFRNLGH